MWNFGIPYKLKHYIDVLTQPGLTFSYSPSEGYKGLVTGKPAAVVYARGGSYPPGSGAEGMDFQKSYFETLLKFIGFTDIRPIVVEPTLADKGSVEKTIAGAKRRWQGPRRRRTPWRRSFEGGGGRIQASHDRGSHRPRSLSQIAIATQGSIVPQSLLG